MVFGLLGHLIGCWRLTLASSAGLAALWGYSFLTRDSGLYFTVLPIMLTIGIAIRSEGIILVLFVIAMLVAQGHRNCQVPGSTRVPCIFGNPLTKNSFKFQDK